MNAAPHAIPKFEYTPQERQPVHRHCDARLIVVLRGAFREEGFGVGGAFVAGDVIIRPALIAHADLAAQAGARYLQFRFAPHFFKKKGWAHGWRAMRSRIDLHDKNIRAMLRSARAPEFILNYATKPAYQEWWGETPFESAAMRIAAGPDVSLSSLALEMNLAPYEFSRGFKHVLGVCPRAYATGARLERALKMMAAGESRFAAIAADCGYFDQSHLCRAVRRELAMTPGEFFKSVRD